MFSSETPVVGELPLIDAAAMAEWCTDLDPEDVAAILERVPEQTHACISDLQAAITGAELQKAKRVAHRLKGMAANLGAARLARLARRVEIESQDLADVERMLPMLSATADDTLAALAAHH